MTTEIPHGPATHTLHPAVSGPRSPHRGPCEAAADEILLCALSGATPGAISDAIDLALHALAPSYPTENDALAALTDALQHLVRRAGDTNPDAIHSLGVAGWWYSGMRLESALDIAMQ
jgi:hypothetical protein